MNVGVSGTITAQDVVRIEKLEEELDELQSKAHDLWVLANSTYVGGMDKMKKVITAGAKAFTLAGDSRKLELHRDMALLRAEMQREKWKAMLSDLEAATQKVVDCLAEIRVRDTMSGLLDACPD